MSIRTVKRLTGSKPTLEGPAARRAQMQRLRQRYEPDSQVLKFLEGSPPGSPKIVPSGPDARPAPHRSRDGVPPAVTSLGAHARCPGTDLFDLHGDAPAPSDCVLAHGARL